MPKLSQRSEQKLVHVDERLVGLLRRAIALTDFAVLCGHRGREAQEEAVASGRSKTSYPNSKHNQMPSLAVDLVPWPVDFKDTERFYFLAGVLHALAAALHLRIRWGGDWDRDGDSSDQSFYDLVHFELFDLPTQIA